MLLEMIQIEVAYAKLQTQLIIPLEVEIGTSAIDAVVKSGILDEYNEIDQNACDLGVFGKVVKHDLSLKQGDRVEIYRPLIADPKEVRKKRAAEGKKMGKGGGDIKSKKLNASNKTENTSEKPK